MGEVKVQSHNVSLTSIDSQPFGSMSIGPPIPEIEHFNKSGLNAEIPSAA